MRVLQLIDSLEAGGAERMAVTIANILVAEIDRSYICTTRGEGVLKNTISKHVGYLFLKRTKKLDLKALFKLLRFIKKENITIVHAHASSFFMGTLLKIVHPKINLIWHDHYGDSQFLNQRPKGILRFCSRFFTHILTVNKTLQIWDAKHLCCKQVELVKNFVIPYQGPKITTLKGASGKRILCLANLRAQKDHVTLLKSFKKVLKIYPDWSLHCVGKNFNDDYAASINDIVVDLRLKGHVYFYGSCTDTDNIISQADIGVLASKSEGLPLALLEYGLGGLAVVVTDVGDCGKVVSNDREGLLIQAESENELFQALELLIIDQKLRFQLGKGLEQTVALKFSKKVFLDQVLSIYQK
ncbi:glycosyltransferase (GT4) [Formosa agariphila KMM 3901]|uniref:Glycosyltransferase (GT4) n=1 Tax=Formosa agariphila (strain DSM 15362 / KCTC 12365 / LMG 23005 / KMM 3901 / M-2Alg 35-1) TaxID=1347342 RepID=T2KMA0_FORAG|nr:glycosyltransferase [Formosa agariphila]CDF80022.1 glycosyltransferase (GT4) [Formosa agariphila KMM 3901]